jgi:Flp pilus assembly pilin Flp
LKQSGQSLQEYAIAIALIAVVAIGGLKLLGGNISNLFGTIGKPKAQNDVQHLYALIGADGRGNATDNPQGVTNALLKLNPVTGRVEITSTTGGVTNATSADGVMNTVSLALAQLAATRMGNGQPLPDDIQQLLRKLSATGTDMGSLYGQIEQQQAAFDATNQVIQQQIAQGKYGGPPYYDSSYVQMTVNNANNYLTFAQTYQQLSEKLAGMAQTDPAVAALQQKVSSYAGAISGITFNNLAQPTFSSFHIDNVKTSDLLSSLSSAPLALQYFAPVATQTVLASPASRDSTFQQSFLSIGQQMQAGTPINADTGLSLSFDLAPTANGMAGSDTTPQPATAASNGG